MNFYYYGAGSSFQTVPLNNRVRRNLWFHILKIFLVHLAAKPIQVHRVMFARTCREKLERGNIISSCLLFSVCSSISHVLMGHVAWIKLIELNWIELLLLLLLIREWMEVRVGLSNEKANGDGCVCVDTVIMCVWIIHKRVLQLQNNEYSVTPQCDVTVALAVIR